MRGSSCCARLAGVVHPNPFVAMHRSRKLPELVDRQDGPNLTRAIIGKVEGKPVEILVDQDDRIKRGKCVCGHFRKYGLRNGPCRHMIALRWGVSAHGLKAFEQSGWLNRMLGRA